MWSQMNRSQMNVISKESLKHECGLKWTGLKWSGLEWIASKCHGLKWTVSNKLVSIVMEPFILIGWVKLDKHIGTKIVIIIPFLCINNTNKIHFDSKSIEDCTCDWIQPEILKALDWGVLWLTCVCQVAWCSGRALRDWQTRVTYAQERRLDRML